MTANEASRREIVGVYPGSFDPVHNGHVTVAERAARLTDRLIVAVAINPAKADKYMFDLDERTNLVRASLAHLANAQVVEVEVAPDAAIEETERKSQVGGLEVVQFNGGVTIDHARELGAQTMYRGTRSNADFEAEIQLWLQNLYAQQIIGIGHNHPDFVDTQTFYRLEGEDHISSSLVRYFKDEKGKGVEHRIPRIQGLVPEPVFEAILPKLS